MYEQYTDEQIVEMLIPKMNKCSNHTKWDGLIEKPWGNADLFKVITTIYRSAYIRGRLGRSFIIGEPKRTEHWVPATEDNVKVGSKVRVSDEAVHKSNPDCYPNVCAVGEVIDISICKILPLIQWPKNSVGGDAVRRCLSRYLEVLLCE